MSTQITRPAPVVDFLNSTLDLFGEWVDTPDRATESVESVGREPGHVTSGLSLVRRAVDSPDPAPRQPFAEKQSLRRHIEGVDAIANTIEQLDDDELTPELRDQLSEELIAAIAGTKKKVDSTARVLALFEHLEAAAAAERDRMTKRVSYYARQTERLQAFVLATLEASQLDRIDGEISTLRRQKNPPSVAPDPSLIGPLSREFVRPPKVLPWEPDKAAIKTAIRAGREVPGFKCVQPFRLERS